MGAGLLAGVHCASMCGGIVGAQQLTQKTVTFVASKSAFARRVLLRALPFNAGRIASYTALGAIAGGATGGMTALAGSAWLNQALFIMVNVMLLALGISMAGNWRLSGALEAAGGRLWSQVQPLAGRLLSSQAPQQRIALGALWGLMPCALVYAMLLAALGSGSAINGALLMLAFGLGTLPNLLAISLAWAWPGQYGATRNFATQSRARMKLLLALVLIGFGVFGLLRLPALVKLHGLTALCHPSFS